MDTGTEFAKDFSAERKDDRSEKRKGTERIILEKVHKTIFILKRSIDAVFLKKMLSVSLHFPS